MQIQVDTHSDPGGWSMPRGFYLGARYVAIAETIDQWFGADYRYVKVTGDDGNRYILWVHDAHREWRLTMFQTRKAQLLATGSRT